MRERERERERESITHAAIQLLSIMFILICISLIISRYRNPSVIIISKISFIFTSTSGLSINRPKVIDIFSYG